MTPAITVLLPVYNVAPFIREAVESVLAQTFRDFELLIINDGSTDETLRILESFGDERIRIVSRPNKGLIATLNEGLALARAPLVARFDGDDVCLPQRLAVQAAYMDAHPEVAALGSDVDYIDEAGAFVARQPAPDGYSDADIRRHRFHKCPFLHPTVIFRRDPVLAAGGYPANALTFEDWLLWMRLMELGQLANLEVPLVKMRINPGSVTIDERWRGPEFAAIRQAALQRGEASAADAARLREIIASQNAGAYKKASYHAFLAKKYLWDNPQPALARKQLREVIRLHPRSREPYLLWLLSWLPSPLVRLIYDRLKNKATAP